MARRRRKKKSAIQRMVTQLKQEGVIQEGQFIIDPPGETKMSEMILALVAPYKSMADTRPAFQNMVSCACLAWNIANLPKHTQQQELNDAVRLMPSSYDEFYEDAIAIISALMKRKERLFPHDKRLIYDYKITETKDQFHLSVVSAMTTKPSK